MAIEKGTLFSVTAELAFIRKEASEDGNSTDFYFQSEEYISEYEATLSLEQIFKRLTPAKLAKYKGNVKFKVNAEQFAEDEFKHLYSVKPYKETNETYVVKFGFSPQSIQNSSVNYAKTKMIKIYEGGWTEYFKELKEEGKLGSNNNRTPAAAAS